MVPAQEGSLMLFVLGCVYYQHDLRMLLAAACICIFACITARAMVLREIGRAHV